MRQNLYLFIFLRLFFILIILRSDVVPVDCRLQLFLRVKQGNTQHLAIISDRESEITNYKNTISSCPGFDLIITSHWKRIEHLLLLLVMQHDPICLSNNLIFSYWLKKSRNNASTNVVTSPNIQLLPCCCSQNSLNWIKINPCFSWTNQRLCNFVFLDNKQFEITL